MSMRHHWHWLYGTAIALAGVAVARRWAPSAGSERALWTLSGHGAALLGLFLIALGTRRKYRRRQDEESRRQQSRGDSG
jgi:hypothetical protein